MSLSTQSIPNLIQGVSQQSAQQRRDSQCEEQYDCFNSPKDGVVARNGFELLKAYPGLNLVGAYHFESIRGGVERYVGAIKGGALKMFNLLDGEEGFVVYDVGYGTYLSNDGGNPQDNFCVQVVDDTAFVAAKQVKPAMLPGLSPARPKEAIVFFKAGSYLTTYTIAIKFAGTVYRFSYTTPDNSVSGNAAFIQTNQICATFFRAMTGAAAPPYNGYGVGSYFLGDPGAGVVNDNDLGIPSPPMGTIGFGFEINGSILRIYRVDGQDFDIDTSDGAGDTALLAFKDVVRTLGDLPRSGTLSYGVRVHGVSKDDSTAYDYYLTYQGTVYTKGGWVESPFPGIKVALDPQTMPHGIVNTAPGTYVVKPFTWGDRIAGDGVYTAKDPYFVGRSIEDLSYNEQRLLIMTEGAVDWSKARNAFTHFPDTAQTILADAPVNIQVSASKRIANLRKALMVDGEMYLWADSVQFRITTQNQEGFKASSVDAKPSTTYEFSPLAGFATVGNTVYFVTEPSEWATVRNLTMSQGKVQGDTDATAHVAELIPAGVRQLTASDTGQALFVRTDGADTLLFLYNYLFQGREVAQSAWNTWRLPGEVLWAYVDQHRVCALLQRTEGVMVVTCQLSSGMVDAVSGAKYRTRLDLRVDETECTVSYAAGVGTTVVLPWTPTVAERANLRVILRADSAGHKRGRSLKVLSVTGASVLLEGDQTTAQFYAGLRVSSERLESEFYIRGQEGVTLTESLVVNEFSLSVDKTGYTRLEVTPVQGQPSAGSVKTIQLGAGVALGEPPALVRSKVRVGVAQDSKNVSIRIVNDSPFPSRWQSAEYKYAAVIRGKPPGASR